MAEKRGGIIPDAWSIQDIHESLLELNLSKVSHEGNDFTWCNNQSGPTNTVKIRQSAM